MVSVTTAYGGLFTGGAKITGIGGYCVELVNKTTTNSIAGKVASLAIGSTNTSAYVNFDGSVGVAPIGIVFEDAEDIGSGTWIAFSGIVTALITTNTFASNGYYVYANTNDSRVIASSTMLTNNATDYANYLIGYSLENVTNHGTNDITCKILLLPALVR
jgi:predicted aconitase with swiveling domain